MLISFRLKYGPLRSNHKWKKKLSRHSCFLRAGARKSGQAVKLLSTAYDEIKEAAAVYAETDVIARAVASEIRTGEILLELMQGAILVHDKTHGTNDTFQVDSVQPFLVDGMLSRVQHENITDSSGTIYAIRCNRD